MIELETPNVLTNGPVTTPDASVLFRPTARSHTIPADIAASGDESTFARTLRHFDRVRGIQPLGNGPLRLGDCP